jgi:Tol biopolymer transport system component
VAFGGAEDPTLSGSQLSQQGVYLLDRNGRHLRLVTDFASSYTGFHATRLNWSPDGRYLAFTSLESTNPDAEAKTRLYLYDTTTGRVINLCQFQTETNTTPLWSPDSRYLAFVDSEVSIFQGSILKILDIYSGELVTVADTGCCLYGWSGVWK